MTLFKHTLMLYCAKGMFGSKMRNVKLQLLIIVLLTFLTYSNIFQNTYTGGDDTWLLLNWKEAYSLSYIPKFFLGKLIVEEKATYRPIRSSIIPIIHQFTGANPFGFHVYSMFIILSSTILVYFITWEIVSKEKKPNTKNFLPFITALLFGLHPIHTEAITFMMAAIDSTGIVFLLLSFYLYIRGIREIRENKGVGEYWYLGSLVTALLAYFTNEIALVLPFLILVYDFLFTPPKAGFTKKISKHAIAFFLTFIFYFAVRISIVGIATKGSYLANSFYLTMLTMVKGLIRYISLLIFPNPLSIYPKVWPGIESYMGLNAPMDKILSQTILDWDILLGLLGLLGMLGLAIKVYRKYPIVTFGISWFFISFVPVSHIVPLNVVLQERYIYLASFGFVLVAGWLLGRLGRFGRFGMLGLVLLLALFYGIVTYQRNRDWHDPISFWSKTVTQVPNFFWANVFLANSYANNRQYDLALKYYYKSLEIVPNAKGILENIDKVNKLKANQTQ